MIIIKIPIDTAPLSPNQTSGHHFSKLVKLGKDVTTCCMIGYAKARRPKVDYPVDVFIIARRAKLMDDDNLIASVKMIFDELFKGLIVPDDAPQWVRVTGARQEIDPRYRKEPEIELQITKRQ